MDQQMQLCFGTVRHARLRPVTHRFAYGVYYLRLPLRALQGRPSPSRLFSFDRFNLLSFHERDHGDGQRPLLDWIEQVLKSEGIDDADGEIVLQAFPRVLGYVFNPVSFWFCHRQDGALRAILCEVRNTFGEKHHYLLDTGAAMPYGRALSARKIFHVSPFCAVEGQYRFRFMRSERENGTRYVARIEHDDQSGTLLQTSVCGSASALSGASVLKAFFAYPLMTFGIVARIHWQALRLWLKGVPFFSKPEPPAQELSR